MDATPAGDRARHAYAHAVEREREAIATHERAASMHEGLAARLELSAENEPNPGRAGALAARVETERQRSVEARKRAAEARERLRSEGRDPGEAG